MVVQISTTTCDLYYLWASYYLFNNSPISENNVTVFSCSSSIFVKLIV